MDLLQTFFNWNVLVESLPLMIRGLGVTVLLGLVSIVLGLVGGLLLALLRLYSYAPVRLLARIYIDIMRSIPLLVLLVLIYYSLPFFGLTLGSFAAVVVALVINNTGYFSEIFRAGLESIPKGQHEATAALGFHRFRGMIYIILPQAVRKVVAPLASNSLELVKTTSIASLVALPELLRSARVAQEQTYNPTPLTAAAVIFFIMLWPFSHWVSRLERKAIIGRG